MYKFYGISSRCCLLSLWNILLKQKEMFCITETRSWNSSTLICFNASTLNWEQLAFNSGKVLQGTVCSHSTSPQEYPSGLAGMKNNITMKRCSWKSCNWLSETKGRILAWFENELLQNILDQFEPQKIGKNVTQLAITEDRFPVGDEIHHYLILGNVLLAHSKLLVAGLLAHLSGQTPASSGILSVWKVHEGAGRHFYELRFSWFEKEPLNSSISSWIKSKSSAVFRRSITLAVVTLYGTDAHFSLLKAQFTIHIPSIWIHVWCDITSLSWKENPL